MLLERRLKDPRLGLVTITDVQITADLRDATVYYTVLGGEAEFNSSTEALESARGMIRSEVGKHLDMRHTPTIAFVADAIPESAARIDELIAQARAADERIVEQARSAEWASMPDPYADSDSSTDRDEADHGG